jgi:hypothetical protein
LRMRPPEKLNVISVTPIAKRDSSNESAFVVMLHLHSALAPENVEDLLHEGVVGKGLGAGDPSVAEQQGREFAPVVPT